ncbi:acetyltransferase [Paenibacillus sp. CMAA1364]
MSYIVYGAGGHAKVVLDILRSCDEQVYGIMDDYCQDIHWNGLPNLGTSAHVSQILIQYPESLFIVAIGDNDVRERIVAQLKCVGVNFGKAIHRSAILGSNVSIGEGTVVMPNVVINADAYIEEHAIINTAATIDHDCFIESFAHISPGVHMAGGVKIGRSSHVGIGACLIPCVRVGAHTTIGAASCVIRDVPSHVIAVGCPAQVIKNL